QITSDRQDSRNTTMSVMRGPPPVRRGRPAHRPAGRPRTPPRAFRYDRLPCKSALSMRSSMRSGVSEPKASVKTA
ncbi:hypothetical protein, partial [Burkholderia pseudomallei]|uniref:hypothetical protein n=1 Tax=Burkholderia pseudomallei TaxID=28450 RepID=UPI001C4CFE74